MAKLLKDILKQAHDTIKGIRPSTTVPGSTGTDPGVDYKPKAGDEDEFVAKHSTKKWDDPDGNGDDVFNATNVKYSLDTPQNKLMGNTQKKAKAAEFTAVKESTTKKVEGTTCNRTPGQTWCPIHEMADCRMSKNIKEDEVNELSTDTMKAYKEKSLYSKDKSSTQSYNRLVGSARAARKIAAKEKPIEEKHLTPAELKKREEIAQAIHRKTPSMPMSKKMAIATATAKKVTEEAIDEVSTKTMGSYITKASAATTDKTLSDKKVRNRYAGVALADKKMNNKFNEDLAIPLLGGSGVPRGDSDDAAEMVKTELKALANKAMHLVTTMDDDMHIAPWVQAKIATAKELVSGVHDYMLYRSRDNKHPENETMDTPMTFPNMSVDVNTGQNV